MTTDNWTAATAVLRLAAQLVEGVQHGVLEAGFENVRPVHGFAFARLSAAPATTVQLAEHLGITKQATSELAQYLVERGYLIRVPAPADRRARLLVLTDRGRDCTRAAQTAASRIVAEWDRRLSAGQASLLRDALAAVASPGPIRPAW